MTKNLIGDIQVDLNKQADIKKAKVYQRFFKTGKGQYGEGDKFIGLTVPQQRAIAKKYSTLSLTSVRKLLQSKIHEYRLTALMILSGKFAKADTAERTKIYNFYLKNTKYINNWDLIDLSSRDVVGAYLLDKPKERKILFKLVKSKSLWERRIAILATSAFFRKNDFRDTLAIAELLLHDEQDLIHKAVGWMLREVGKRDQKTLIAYLDKHHKTMPRTMLRYAIERFSKATRRAYLGRP